MTWISELFFGSGVAHTILVLAITVALGIVLGKIKIAGVSLGITWILFVGILLSHYGMRIDASTLKFIKEFGLILFVFSVGMQVGPGFFSAFKKGGIQLNMLAMMTVFLGVITTYVIHLVTGLPITTMVGIMSGAVTNTPGLGAAEQAFEDMSGMSDPTIALGYAVAYPLGVIGIILAIILFRYLFRISFEKEIEMARSANQEEASKVTHASMMVKNPALFGKEIGSIAKLVDKKFVISRVLHSNDKLEIGTPRTTLSEGDKLFVIASPSDLEAIATFIGERIDMHRADWTSLDSHLVARKVMITNSGLNGKQIRSLHLRRNFGINITRVNRSSVQLVAHPDLQLFLGDRVTLVGDEVAIDNAAKMLGNSMKRLNEPHLIPIFFGIFLGVLLGSIPFMIPGIPQPVKLGLAGGPLIVAILISRFGYRYKLVTYTTLSANLMLREVGISLFLAAVGLGAGHGFVETIVEKGGYAWIGYGFIITVVPLLIVGAIARLIYKMNYFTLIGMIAGSTTDPPALAYASSSTGNDMPAVSYATVYPLTMFLRVLSAQLLILLLA